MMRFLRRFSQYGMVAVVTGLVGACSGPWNNPYPASESGENILYSSFSERPKHLDPARSYSSNEYEFLGQIYEPPLQYHYLKRPYELIPLTATEVPKPEFYDAEGKRLPNSAPADQVAFSVYDIHIKPGIRYQPHPAFAKGDDGQYLYHDLTTAEIEDIYTLDDLPQTASRELVAGDYVYQIKRLAHPRVHSPIFGLMSDYIVGLRELATTLAQADKQSLAERGDGKYLDLAAFPLEGAQVVDRYTYRIKVRGKYPQLVYWLAMPFFAPMPAEADRFYAQPGMAEKNITLDWYPVGTGAYMLTVNNPNRQMVLQRNPYFDHAVYPSEGEPGDREAGLLADAGKPLPFIDKVVYSLEKEAIPYWNKFLQGYYDTSGISSESFDQAVQVGSTGDVGLTDAMKAKNIRLSTAVQATIGYMGFNMLDPVVGGDGERARKLRRAISIAMDYEEFISIFMNGRGIAAQGPIPPGIVGHVEGRAGINPYVYDWVNGAPKRKALEEARRLLKEAGYPGGVDAKSGKQLVLYLDTASNGGPDDKARFNWYRKQLAKLNIQLVVRATMYNRFQEKMRKGTAQLFMWGWNADYPDPENFFFLLYGPNNKVEHNGENAANYQNPRFDALFEKMKNMENGPERANIIREMMEIVQRDAPWLWGVNPKSFGLHHAWYQNAKPNLMAHNTLMYKRIDAQLRDEKRSEWNRPIIWPVFLVIAVLVIGTIPAVVTYRRKEHMAPKGS